jgi:signal transduction histidine kinase
MNTISGQVLNFLVTPPGNLVYHLVLVFSVIASIQVLLIVRPHHSYPYTLRILFALYVLLAGQIILFLIGLLSWIGVIDPRYILPPLERAISLISLISIIWVWAFERPLRLADFGALAGFGVILIYFIITLLVWGNQSDIYTFNFTTVELTWTILSLFIALVGLALVYNQRPADWAYATAIIGLFFLGYLVHLTWGSIDVDFAGPVRLAELCAFPLLPFLVQRLLTSPVGYSETSGSPLSEPKRYTAEAQTIYSWLQSIFPDCPDRVGAIIARAIAQTMMADICYLVSVPTVGGDVNIQVGFDLTKDQELPGLALTESGIPQVAEALRQGQPITITDNTLDLLTINSSTGTYASSFLMIPLKTSQIIWGGAILLSPYSNRDWNTRDQSYLAIISEYIVRILIRGGLLLSSDIDPIIPGNTAKSQFLPTSQLPPHKPLITDEQRSIDLEALKPFRQNAEEIIANLNLEIRQLQAGFATQKSPSLISEIKDENGATLINQMHNPLISAHGYTELLLSESIGILGSLQTAALLRIRTSIIHLRGLLNDLKTNPSDADFTFQTASIGDIIDEAIADTSTQRREKNINLRVDLPDVIPQAQIDREVMRQVLVELLQNAGTATPSKGSVGLQVRHETWEDNLSCLIFQITDSGGGIDPKALPGLFASHQKSKSSRIKGIGSRTNIQIASTLIETYGGKITVNSDRGKSTTFTVRLPLQQNVAAPSAL